MTFIANKLNSPDTLLAHFFWIWMSHEWQFLPCDWIYWRFLRYIHNFFVFWNVSYSWYCFISFKCNNCLYVCQANSAASSSFETMDFSHLFHAFALSFSANSLECRLVGLLNYLLALLRWFSTVPVRFRKLKFP